MGRLFFHEKVIQAFYDIDFYIGRRTEKKKSVLLYVLVLALFIGLLSSIFNMRDFYMSVSELKDFMNTAIPDFKVIKGEMVIEGTAPTQAVIHDKDGLLLIFDPMGEAYNLYLTKLNGFYLTKDRLLIKNLNKEQTFLFKDSATFVYDKASLKRLAEILTSPTAVIVGVLVVIVLHILFIFTGFFIHFTIGNMINTLLGYPLKPEEVMPVTAYSLTVPALLYLAFVMLYWNSGVVLFMASIIVNAIVLGGIKMKLNTQT